VQGYDVEDVRQRLPKIHSDVTFYEQTLIVIRLVFFLQDCHSLRTHRRPDIFFFESGVRVPLKLFANCTGSEILQKCREVGWERGRSLSGQMSTRTQK
jgi:hypothetical protein